MEKLRTEPFTADELRAWADRADTRSRQGFGVGPGVAAETVSEALRALADKREREV